MKTITENAFLARVRRRLARDGERLNISRREILDSSEYRYTALSDMNYPTGGWDSIGDMLRFWAIEDGLLRPGEVVKGWEEVTAYTADSAIEVGGGTAQQVAA